MRFHCMTFITTLAFVQTGVMAFADEIRLSVSDVQPARVHVDDLEEPCLAPQVCCDCDASCSLLQALLGAGGHGVQARGWLAQGLTWNPDRPPNNSNFPVTFNDRANEYQMNQLYLSFERAAEQDGCCWSLGGRVDLLYGTDYVFTTAMGLETQADGSQRWNGNGPRGVGPGSAALYGLAMPQLYAEIYAPVLDGMNIKLGHFYSPLGYEGVMASRNFFYSHSYSLQYGEPLTLTGAVANCRVSRNLQLLVGGMLGWNSFDSSRDQWGVLAGVEWEANDGCTSLAWMVHTGDDGPPGVNSPAFFPGPTNAHNVTLSTLVLTRQVTDRLQYVFQHDFGVEQDGEFSGGTFNAAKWYGINQYLLYELNDCWSFGVRFEWFRDQDHSRVLDLATGAPLVSGGNYYALTAGANWSPWTDVVVRPEIRWDWSDTQSPVLGVGGPFSFFAEDDQLTAAFDVIVAF